MLVQKHIKILSENKIPKNFKGDEYKVLEYVLDGENLVKEFFDAMMKNDTFKGELILQSNENIFDDSIGFKIGLILEKDNLQSLVIKNKDTPFSDRVSSYIGDVIFKCTNLKKLEMYMKISDLSFNHIFQFLMTKTSQLETLKCLLISNEFIRKVNEFSPHFNKNSRLSCLEFYYEPFTKLNLLYKKNKTNGFIDQNIYEEFSDVIQMLPKLVDVKIIPWYIYEGRKKKKHEYEVEVKRMVPIKKEVKSKIEDKENPDNKENMDNEDNNDNNENEDEDNEPKMVEEIFKETKVEYVYIHDQDSIKKNNEMSIPQEISSEIEYDDFIEYNKELVDDINKINITFEFACELNADKRKQTSKIEKSFNEADKKMCKIM